MRYISFVNTTNDAGEPPQALFDAIAASGAKATAEGTLVETGALALSARAQLVGGEVSADDHPFTEQPRGYAILEVQSTQDAVAVATSLLELHHKHWPGWEGEIEISQAFVQDFS